MWTVWNKKDKLNGFSAEFILSRNTHLAGEETIFIKTVGNRTTQIEGKSILAGSYNIDTSLSDEEFIAEYEKALAKPIEETVEETIEEHIEQ